MLANRLGYPSGYQLSIVPQSQVVSLFGRPLVNSRRFDCLSEYSQNLYGCCDSIDELIDLLGSRLGLSSSQLKVILKTAREGKRQVIGGQDGTRIFERADLERLGLEPSPAGLFKRPAN
jgi:hypothetical protein